MVNLALYGHSGSGKSFLAGLLVSEYGYQHVSTGNICRSVAEAIFGDQTKEHLNLLSAKLRELSADIWINAALRQAHPNVPIVFDSVRYPSDYRYFSGAQYRLIRVKSAAEIERERLQFRGQVISDADLAHPAERSLEKFEFDGTILNDGRCIDEIRQQINAYFAIW